MKKAGDEWTDETIRGRTQDLIGLIKEVWPVPPDHRSGFAAAQSKPHRRVDLSDLLNAGLLHPGMQLVPKQKKFSHLVATLLPDGRVEVDGIAYADAREAATSIYGKKTGGWWFFLTDPQSRRSLRDVRREYIEAMAVDTEDDEQGEEDEDDET